MHNLTISGYTTLRMLGEGGMSTVWYAENRLKLPAAIKFLKPELLVVPAIRQRFRDEAEALTSLKHPNIRAVLDYEETDGHLAIVFEYLDGQDLDEWLETHGPASPKDAKKWTLQALSALQQAHNQGIVHRDIKPANLFLTLSGELKILDFGIAKIVGSEAGLTRTNRAIGSPMYMSPEQVRTPKDVDHRSDLYSLGVTLHALLTGRKPYDDETDSEFDILRKVVDEPLPPLGVASRTSATQFADTEALEVPANTSFPEPVEGNDATREALNAIIARATAKNRDNRYPDCAAFAADLQGVLSADTARSDVNANTPSKPKPADITLVEGVAFSFGKREETILDRSGPQIRKPDIAETVNGVRFTMKHIPGGTFLMGDDMEKAVVPIRPVNIESFFLAETPVTQALYRAVMKVNPSHFRGKGWIGELLGGDDNPDFPVESVSWEDAQKFILKLNQLTNTTYRFPTEAEWEYAAGGGSSNRTKWSGTSKEGCLGDFACYIANSNGKISLVKSKTANQFGIYGMSGNVFEWCEDLFITEDTSVTRNSNMRVIRGGAWSYPSLACRVSNRAFTSQTHTCNFIGFRLARTE